VKLTVLGCSGTYPGPDSACSSYLIEHDGFRLMLDAGNGATGTLQRHCDLRDVDAVVISHLHGDHYLDLVTYTYARHYHPDGAAPRLPVHGPSTIASQLASAFAKQGVQEMLDEVYDFRPVDGARRLEIGPFTVELAAVNHPVETYGVRLSADGRSLAYSADTGTSDSLVDLARDTDLFLCEASFLDGEDNPPGIHLTGRQAAEHAVRAQAGRLVLTHLVPWGDPQRALAEAQAVFDGDLVLASTGAHFEV
jgi:ribonuclease BN (tRNA processing enzyme)